MQKKEIQIRKRKTPMQNRCSTCNKLLGVGEPGNIIIKCPRCRSLNRFTGFNRQEQPETMNPVKVLFTSRA